MIDLPEPDPRPGRKLCPACGATPGGCNGLRGLCGRRCCDRCTGNHDEERKNR